MEFIYVVIENGEPYPEVYRDYMSAVESVKKLHEEYILEFKDELDFSDLDIPENVEAGKTYLYIEKGIHIYIYKYPISK